MKISSKKAEEVLNLYWDGALPVNPVYIANKLGIEVYKDNLDGILLNTSFSEKKYSITVGYGEKISRHRFFIAHGIGHIVLNHINQATTSINDENDSFMTGAKNMEKEANSFALALLIPERLIRTWFLRMIGTDITEAAKMFDISEAAIYQRLLDLDLIKE